MTFRCLIAFLACGFLALVGCASSTESAGSQQLTANVGNYPPPPPGVGRPRVGVPPFALVGVASEDQLANVAADQCTTLLVRANRFNVIERAQLEQLVGEQNLEGIVREDERAAKGEVRGVDYLFLGKVTTFRVKKTETGRGFGLGKVSLPYAGGIGITDVEKKDAEIKVEVGIDLRFVDPSTGAILAADTSDYTRSDKVSAFGLEIIGVSASADADIELSEDNKGLVLRLAIDECIRKMLPSVDSQLRNLEPASAAATPTTAAPAGTTTSTTTDAAGGSAATTEAAPATDGAGVGAAKFCSNCGTKLDAGAKFCGSCGTQISG